MRLLNLSADAALSALSASSTTDLLGGLAVFKNSANSGYESRASPSVSILRTIASNSVSVA